MKKSILSIVTLTVLLGLVCLLGLSGCAGTVEESPQPPGESAPPAGQSPPDEAAAIRFAGFSAGDDNRDTMRDMLALFADAHPQINAVDESAGYGDYFTELAVQIGGGDAPDVFELNEDFNGFIDLDIIQPLGELAEVHGSDMGVYQEGLIKKFCTRSRQLMGLPFSFGTVMLVYNIDLFDEAGAAYPTDDWTWEDVLITAQQIAEPGEDIWGCYYAMDDFYEFYSKTAQNGGRILNKEGFTLDSPQNVEALQWMQDLVWVFRVMPTEAERGGRSEQDLFAAGRLGMFMADTGSFPDLRERCGDMRWGVAIEPGNVRKATRVSCNLLCVNTSTQAPDAAYTLAHFLSSDPGVARLRLDAQWELPPVSDPVLAEAYAGDTPPENKAAVQGSLSYSLNPLVPDHYGLLADILVPHLQSVRDNTAIPREALDAAQWEAEAQIDLPE